MAQTRFNGIVTITNDEVYDLATHQARMADSTNVIKGVNSVTERNALAAAAPGGVLPVPTTVRRMDRAGKPLETWDGSVWLTGAKVALPLFTTNYQADPPRADGIAQQDPSYELVDGRVYLSGVASNKVTITFTGGGEYILGYLPVGYRPAKAEYFSIEVAFTTCRVWVRPDGEIRFMFGSTITNLAAPLAKFSLSGMSFDAA